MKRLKGIIFLLAILVFSVTVRAQIKPLLKYGLLDVGIHGLDNTDQMIHSPDGNKLILSSSINGCMSVFKKDETSGDWYHFQSAFLEDFECSSAMYFPIAFSPSGENLYAVCYDAENEQIVCNFTFNENTDSLELFSIFNGFSANQVGEIGYIETSQDGKYVFGVNNLNLFQFLRNEIDGALTLSAITDLEEYEDYWIHLSPDSKNLYLLSGDSFVKNFQIDDQTGDLNLLEMIESTLQNNYLGLQNPNDFDIDPLGEYLYFASNELSVFSRNTENGALTFFANQENLGKPDLANNQIRAITTLYVDKLNNLQVHLYSQRDGWIIMDKDPELDTLVFNRIVEQEIPGSWYQNRKLISVDTNILISYNGDNSLHSYIYQSVTDSVVFSQQFLANENALDRPISLLFTPEEDNIYVMARQALTLFDRQPSTGMVNYIGSIDMPGNTEATDICINQAGSHLYVVKDQIFVFKVLEDNQLPLQIQEVSSFENQQNLVILSNDSKNLYAATHTYQSKLLTYDIDTEGLLTITDTINREEDITDFCFSKDSRFLYTVSRSDHNLIVYSRDTVTGLLTEIQELDASNFWNGVLAYATKIILSRDERFVYTGSQERTIGLLERDTITGLLTMIGSAGNSLPNKTKRLHTLNQSIDDRYMTITHTWWDDAVIYFSRDSLTGELKEVITIDEDNEDIPIKGSMQLLNDKNDRFLYVTGWNFLAGYKIDPIVEDTILIEPFQDTVIYANPYYQEYNWSVSALNQNSIITQQLGWISLMVEDEFEILRYDSVYIDEYTSIDHNFDKSANLILYPNPVQDILNISCHFDDGEVCLRIYGMDGRLLQNKKTYLSNGFISLDISGLMDGAYILQLINWDTYEMIGKKTFIKK